MDQLVTSLLNQMKPLLERLEEGVVVMAREGEILYQNGAARALMPLADLPWSMEGLREAMTWLDAEERPLVFERGPLGRALAGEAVSDEEVVLQEKGGGRRRRVRISGGPMALGLQEGLRLVTIREIRAVEPVTLAWKRRYEQAILASGLVMFDWDPASDVITFAGNCHAVLGIAPGAMPTRGIACAAMIHPEDLENLKVQAQRVLTSPSTRFQFRFRMLRQDGTWVDVMAAGQASADGAARRVIGVFSDITTERQAALDQDSLLQTARAAAETAEQADRAKDQFLAALSHELRTPLSPALMTIVALERNTALPEPVRQDLGIARRNIELEIRILNDLLDLSRVISGKLQLERQVVRIQDLVRHAIQICAADIQSKHLALHCDFAAQEDRVSGDATRLQQVFWNLLKNAIKFTPGNGQITLLCRNLTAGQVQVQVRDTGVGISPEALERIFIAFEQADTSISRRFGGLGLGLAISKAMVDAHGGTITASSDGPGFGAAFTVELPLASPAELEASMPVIVPPLGPSPGLRLLVVEDHGDTLRTLSRLLRYSGHTISTAQTIAEARQLLESQPFDLLLSDLGLPDGDGCDLMRYVQSHSNIPGICMSGFGMESDLARTREAGFIAHLVKPVSIDQLQQTLHLVTGQRARADMPSPMD